MKKSLAVLAAAGVSSTASAQALDFEPSISVVAPGESVTLTVFGDPGPSDLAIAWVEFQVDATGGEWTDWRHHISTSQSPGPANNRGAKSPDGRSILGISLGQLDPSFGFDPEPGRIRLWSGDWESELGGAFDITTTTTRMEVYIDEGSPGGYWPRRPVTPTEGFSQVTVIPAPAGVAVLGLGGLAAMRRTRRVVFSGLREEGEIR